MKNDGSTSGAGGEDGGGGTKSGNGKRSLTTVVDPVEGLQTLPELPGSERVFVTDGDIRVPMRRISVGANEPPVDVYDPCGPAGGGSARRAAQAAAAMDRPARRARRRQLQPDALRPARRDHRGDAVLRAARRRGARVRARRGGARSRHHPRQPQPPRVGADDHRPQLPGEDQREHRQLRGVVVDRRRGREAALVDALGRRHGDGSVDRATTSTRRASGSSATRRCRSAPCRSTRRWRR